MSTSKLNGLILNSKTAFTLSVPCVPKGSLSRESIKIKLARLSIYIPAFFRALFFLWTIFEGGHFGRNLKILSNNRAFSNLNGKNMVPYAIWKPFYYPNWWKLIFGFIYLNQNLFWTKFWNSDHSGGQRIGKKWLLQIKLSEVCNKSLNSIRVFSYCLIVQISTYFWRSLIMGLIVMNNLSFD